MAGILANSVSVTHTSAVNGETKDEYVTSEMVTLTTTPTGSTYVWSLARASGSVPARSALSSTTAAAPTFTPDVEGSYVVTCVVDGSTTYTLQMTVTKATVANAVGGLRLLPVADASVPTPSTGVIIYYSSTQSALSQKDTSGNVSTVDVTAV